MLEQTVQATMSGNLQRLKSLLAVWNSYSTSELKICIYDALVAAAENGQIEVLSYLLSQESNAGNCLEIIDAAIKSSSIECLELLVKHGWHFGGFRGDDFNIRHLR